MNKHAGCFSRETFYFCNELQSFYRSISVVLVRGWGAFFFVFFFLCFFFFFFFVGGGGGGGGWEGVCACRLPNYGALYEETLNRVSNVFRSFMCFFLLPKAAV